MGIPVENRRNVQSQGLQKRGSGMVNDCQLRRPQAVKKRFAPVPFEGAESFSEAVARPMPVIFQIWPDNRETAQPERHRLKESDLPAPIPLTSSTPPPRAKAAQS